MKSRISRLVAVVLLSAAPLAAQVVTGAISGRITDNTGAVIAGATVQIQNVETGLSRNAQSDASGRYEVRNLPPGSYTVTAQQSGFKTEVRSGITLSVASEAVVNLELSVGAVAEKVEVSAEAPAIETTTAALSGLVNPTQMRDLPLNGRSIDQLALLTPGVVQETNVAPGAFGGEGMRLVINGSRPTHVLYLLDGTVSSDYNMNGPGSAASESLGVEAIREFRVLTHSYSAEYGRASGGVFSAITRSGTNDFHGSAYEFVRNNIFDARNFFNLGALPPFRRNQFGASLGGRIVKDRLFFFANYEGLRQRQALPSVSFVPDLNARQGLVPNSSGTLVPVGPGPNNGINPAAAPYLALIPLPNLPALGGGIAKYNRDNSIATGEDYSMARLDFRLSDKDSLYWRMVYDPSSQVLPPSNFLPVYSDGGTLKPWFSGNEVNYQYYLASETHIFSPTSLNEFRFAFNRTYPRTTTGPLVIQNHALDFLPGAGFGTLTFSGTAIATGAAANAALTSFGNGQTAPRDLLHNLFEATDTFSLVRGAHSFKFGADLERLQANYRWTPFPLQRGVYAFSSLSNFLLSLPSQLQFPELSGNSSPIRGWRQTVFGWFVQDELRVRSNLTLTLGLRHEFVTAPNEVNGRSANLPCLTCATSVIGPAYPTKKNNFGPRVGVAWDPTGSGKTSVRAGFGMFYNLPIMGRIWDTSTFDYRFATSYTVNSSPSNLSLGFPNALLSGYAPGLQTTRDLQADLGTATSMHWNLEIARQLTSSMSVQVGYVGSHNYHLEQAPQADRALPTALADGSPAHPFPAGATLLNSNFTSIQWSSTPGWGHYHALQAGFQRRFSAGLSLQAGYTWSKNMSSVDQQFGGEVQGQLVGPMNLFDLPRDYSLSTFDQRHVFDVNGKYKLPWDNRLKSGVAKAALGGWEINTVWRATSGLPATVGAGFNVSRSRDALSSDRPNLNPGFSNNPSSGVTAGCQGVTPGQTLGTPTLYFDPCAFSLPTPGVYGNLGRNTLIGPGVFNADLGVVKNTKMTERFNLEFRAEFFNLLNHANFRLPATSVFLSSGLRNTTVGQITGTSIDNREIQFGLKLTF
jgi:hypothetical protein